MKCNWGLSAGFSLFDLSHSSAPGAKARLFKQLPARFGDLEPRVALVLVVDLLHFFDRIEVTNDERRTEGFTRSNRATSELEDHTDVASLVAPRFMDNIRVQDKTC